MEKITKFICRFIYENTKIKGFYIPRQAFNYMKEYNPKFADETFDNICELLEDYLY